MEHNIKNIGGTLTTHHHIQAMAFAVKSLDCSLFADDRDGRPENWGIENNDCPLRRAFAFEAAAMHNRAPVRV